MKRISLILTLNWFFSACGQKNIAHPSLVMYSRNVKDSFDIYINIPKDYNANERHSIFYYLDANIKSGNKIREILRDSTIKKSFTNTIFVGIGHRGDFHELRRRDFTIPKIVGNDTFGLQTNFGQIDHFYKFLKTELIPYIDNHYNTITTDNSLLGHSFGGLFTIYSLFQNDTIFKHFYALSPSLWVSNYSIYKFNKLNEQSLNAKDLFLSVGSLEIFNRVKAGSDQFDDFLKSKKYPGLIFHYEIYKGETHNSEVTYAINDILCSN